MTVLVWAGALCLLCAVPRAQAGLIEDRAPAIQDDGNTSSFESIAQQNARMADRDWQTSALEGIENDRAERIALGMTGAEMPIDVNTDAHAGTHRAAHSLQLPPGPSSLSLLISAALSVGAWQCGRFAHRGIGAVVRAPDWYHTGGPVQVSDSTPWDISAFDTPIADCLQPAFETDLPTPQHVGAVVSRLLYERLFTTLLPHRGPPISN